MKVERQRRAVGRASRSFDQITAKIETKDKKEVVTEIKTEMGKKKDKKDKDDK